MATFTAINPSGDWFRVTTNSVGQQIWAPMSAAEIEKEIEKMGERVYPVAESVIQAVIYAASEMHQALHCNRSDFEACDHPVCEAAWNLEEQSGVFAVMNAE